MVMRPLNIVSTNPCTISLQFFDYLHAYWHAQYDDQLIIRFSQETRADGSINVCLLDQSRPLCAEQKPWEQFDLVLLDNRGESLENHGQGWIDLLHRHPNVFLLCGAMVTGNHDLFDKIICFNHNLTLFTDCVSRPFYPQHFQLKRPSSARTKPMLFINGQNRAWRQYFMNCLADCVGNQINLKNSYTQPITKLLDCEFESREDTEFRTWLNSTFATGDTQHHEENLYYDSSISVGIDEKFGSIPPGYFFLPEYFDHACIVYPETSWINNSLFVTEKTWKCFVSQAIPWPIGGANFHVMLNDKGFKTARDLLPDELKVFDTILDHKERYAKQVEAIRWAQEHPEIWVSQHAESCRRINHQKFWINGFNQIGLERFSTLVNDL